MSKSYSIAEAKNQLSRLVHEAEDAGRVELTRRGRPVAVVLSLGEYRRLQQGSRRTVSMAIDDLRSALDDEGGYGDGDFEGLRDESSGREVAW